MADAIPPRRPPPPLLDEACALFLDVDGTLLEFAVQPDHASLPLGALEVLGRISDRLDGALALVSGRPLSDLDRLFAPMQLPAAGLHGLELRGAASCAAPHSGDALAALRREAAQLAERHPGVLIEDKGANLALHWRAAPAAAMAVTDWARARLPQLPGYRLQPGDHVIELLPADVDKGRALHTLMAATPFHGRVPVFVGDDLTDEHGFAAANAAGGWSVRVGTREPSQARYCLANPSAVHDWLRRNALPPRPGA